MTATTGSPTRAIEFERCLNFRDLGGYVGKDGRRVRWRRLFRSMTPEYMTEADVALARSLGVHLVIDLRGGSYDSGPLGEAPGRRFPIARRRAWRWGPGEAEAFRTWPPEIALPRVLDQLKRGFARGVDAIAETDEPVLFHCRLGKDRSGIMGALLLKLLGVSDEDVIEDYLLTGDITPLAEPLLALNGNNRGSDAVVVKEPASRPGIEAVLRRIEEYGGAYAFLRRYGVPKYRLDALIERLLEPAS